jgi:hypothetical protein
MTRGTENEIQLPTNLAFVVQLKANPTNSENGLEGRIEHITTGDANYFKSAEELYEIIRSSLARQRAQYHQD